MRHAQADSSFQGADFDKPLTEEGKQHQTVVANYLEMKGWLPERILTSPLLRARQTAQIIANKNSHVVIDPVEALGEYFDSEEIIQALDRHNLQCQAVIGHAPTLGYLIAKLIGRPTTLISVEKSSLAVINFSDFSSNRIGNLEEYKNYSEMKQELENK